MTEILKDIENVAAAGSNMRARLLLVVGVVIVGALLGLGVAHHFEDKGRQLERAGWLKKEAAERTADLALVRKHDVDMRALDARHHQIERETSEKHETELAQLRRDRDADRRRADAAGGLRIPAAACPTGGIVAGTEAASAGGRDETGAGTVRLPQQIEDDLWTLANDADEVSGQLRACQGWIVSNEFYGPYISKSHQLLGNMIGPPNKQPEDTHD